MAFYLTSFLQKEKDSSFGGIFVIYCPTWIAVFQSFKVKRISAIRLTSPNGSIPYRYCLRFSKTHLYAQAFLHFGQNSGKCVRTVSSRSLSLVLFPQTGQYTHSCYLFKLSFSCLKIRLDLSDSINVHEVTLLRLQKSYKYRQLYLI